jgi:pyruvate formate lyase activating enzyme
MLRERISDRFSGLYRLQFSDEFVSRVHTCLIRPGGIRIHGSVSAPEEIVRVARASGCRSIAYTYTEPTVFFEYALDVARLARAIGVANLFVTNGYMCEQMLSRVHPYLDAANVDLKAFRDSSYRRYVGARLQLVLNSLRTIKRLGIWLEVTSLIIPELNDDELELRETAAFLVQELGPDTPWHISRFFPNYHMTDRLPTSLETLQRAREIGWEEGLHYIYIGNASEGQDTFCPGCNRLLVCRPGLGESINSLRDGHCPDCGTIVAGVWE